MLEEYRTVLGHGESEIVEKKSRFLAEVSHIDTEEEALEFIEKIRKKHYNATHHAMLMCWASVLNYSVSATMENRVEQQASRCLMC